MKKYSVFFLILAMLFGVVSCKDSKKDKEDYSFKMSRVNLNGARYLALGTKEGAKDDENGGYLYSVDDEGNLQIMAYEYDCENGGVATELKRNLTIQITQMIPVGDVYIWLMGCRYQCDDYSGFSEDMTSRIRGTVEHSWLFQSFRLLPIDLTNNRPFHVRFGYRFVVYHVSHHIVVVLQHRYIHVQ